MLYQTFLMFFTNSRSFVFSLFSEVPLPVSTVEGLKWGQYVGSPAFGAPAVVFTQALNASLQTLVCLKNETVFALSRDSTLLTVHQLRPGESEERLLWSAALSWGYIDGCLRVGTAPGSTPLRIMEHHTPDKVSIVTVTSILLSSSSSSSSSSLLLLLLLLLFIFITQCTFQALENYEDRITSRDLGRS